MFTRLHRSALAIRAFARLTFIKLDQGSLSGHRSPPLITPLTKLKVTNCKDPKYPKNTIPAQGIFQAIKHSSVIANTPDT
jgi:hypothetical protein